MNSDSRFACYYDWCNKTYDSKYSLRNHINVCHLRKKHYACKYCKKNFVCSQNLREHEYIHTGERPYICQVPNCHRAYRQSSQLSMHKKSHEIQDLQRLQLEFSVSDEPQELRLTDLPLQNIFIDKQVKVMIPFEMQKIAEIDDSRIDDSNVQLKCMQEVLERINSLAQTNIL